jgi:hypothetical protein
MTPAAGWDTWGLLQQESKATSGSLHSGPCRVLAFAAAEQGNVKAGGHQSEAVCAGGCQAGVQSGLSRRTTDWVVRFPADGVLLWPPLAVSASVVQMSPAWPPHVLPAGYAAVPNRTGPEADRRGLVLRLEQRRSPQRIKMGIPVTSRRPGLCWGMQG